MWTMWDYGECFSNMGNWSPHIVAVSMSQTYCALLGVATTADGHAARCGVNLRTYHIDILSFNSNQQHKKKNKKETNVS